MEITKRFCRPCLVSSTIRLFFIRVIVAETSHCAGYTPNKPVAIIAGGLFGALSFVLFLRLLRRKDWWGLCLPIGTLSKANVGELSVI